MRGSSASARVLVVVAHKGAALSVARAPASEVRAIDNDGLHEAGCGPDDFE